MAYEVTATRRRPQRFEDLIGQEFVAATLKNSIQSGKIAHAYLFSGPRGCGKTSTARILAKALNCQSGTAPTPTPCGTCTACVEITKGSSMDVIEIDGASNTSVNDVRQIRDEVQFPPNSCRYKIYIIDEVHMLSTSAFNALLKTIEEPPPYVIFIFATTELQKVPATIKSRCQQFNFRLVPAEQVKDLLAQAAGEVHIQADDEALYWIARESTGSIRDAYTLFDQVAAFSDGHITYEKIRDKLGLTGVDRLNSLFDGCASGQMKNVIDKLDEYLESGISVEQLIINSADYLRSMLLLKNGIRKEALLGQAPERYSSTVLETWNSVQIERALSLFLQLYRDIRYSLSPRYELELTFSRLCWLSNYVSSAEVKTAIEAARKLLMQAPAKERQGEPEKGTSPEAKTPGSGNAGQQVPPGELPHFSALGNLPVHDSSPAGQQPEVPHPFSEGGVLPPEKAVTVEHEADSWANTETPPDSDSSDYDTPEDEEQIQEQETVADMPAPGVDPEAVRKKVITELSVSDGFTASLLMQTGPWTRTGTSFTTTVDSAFKKEQLDRQRETISDCLSKVCKTKLTFNAQILAPEEKKQEQTAIPPQVNLLCRVFRGNIVGGKK